MYTEFLMMSYMIGAMEGRDVETSDISGEFLQTSYGRVDIHIKIQGVVVTLLQDIDLAHYKDFIYLDIHGIKCMYAEANKAIYGTLEA